MEQDKSLEQEVNDIYRAIQEREDFIKAINIDIDIDKGKNPESRQKNRILFYTSIVVIALSYSLIWIRPPSITMVIIISAGILFGYLLMLLSSIIDILLIKKEMPRISKGSLNLLFDGLYLTAGHDVAFTKALLSYSTRSLIIVKNRLSSQYTLVQHRLNSTVGSLNKLGILPGLLAISVTLYNQDYHQVTIHIAVILFVFYAIAHWANSDFPRIHFYVQMLEDEVSTRS